MDYRLCCLCERVLNSGRIVRDDGSHYESEQLEVKWPTTVHIKAPPSRQDTADGTFQRTTRFLMMTGNPL